MAQCLTYETRKINNSNNFEKLFNTNANLSTDLLTISSISYSAEIYDKYASVTINMQICNNSHECTEFYCLIPYLYPHKLSLLSIEYEGDKHHSLNPLKEFSRTKFDDSVAEGNFTIVLDPKQENETYITLANFQPGKSCTIQFKLVSNLKYDSNFYIFEIPLISNCNETLYPNYSIELKIMLKELTYQGIQLEYNNSDHSESIKNLTEKTIKDITLQSNFILRIPHKQTVIDQISTVNESPDIVFFINDHSILDPKLNSSILYFLKNYGERYRFNIIRIGPNGACCSEKMNEKNVESLNNAEKFLEEPKTTNKHLKINDTYSNVFGYSSNQEVETQTTDNSQSSMVKPREKLIKDVDRHNTIAIFIGSFDRDLITPQRTKTYVIDPYNLQNTEIFASKNNFFYISTTKGIDDAFDSLLKMLRTNPTKDSCETKEDIDEIKVVEEVLLENIINLKHFIKLCIQNSYDEQESRSFFEKLLEFLDLSEKDDKIKTLITKKLNSNFIDIVFGKLVKESKVKNKDTLRRKYGQHLLNNIDGFLEYVLDFKEYINQIMPEEFLDPEFLYTLVKTNEQIIKIIAQYKLESTKTNSEFHNFIFGDILYEKYTTIVRNFQIVSGLQAGRSNVPLKFPIQGINNNPQSREKLRVPEMHNSPIISINKDSSLIQDSSYVTSNYPNKQKEMTIRTIASLIKSESKNTNIGEDKQFQYQYDEQYKEQEREKEIYLDRKNLVNEYLSDKEKFKKLKIDMNNNETQKIIEKDKYHNSYEEGIGYYKNEEFSNRFQNGQMIDLPEDRKTNSSVERIFAQSNNLEPVLDLFSEGNDNEPKLGA